MSNRKTVRLQCTTTPQVSEGIEALLWGGLHGKTRSEVIERLICRGLILELQNITAITEQVREDKTENQ